MQQTVDKFKSQLEIQRLLTDMLISFRWNSKHESLEAMMKSKKESCHAHTVEVSHCSLKNIGKVFGWPLTKTLIKLQINHCGLRALTGLDQFYELRELEVKYNEVAQMGRLGLMKNLQNLNLEGNPISSDRRELIQAALLVTTVLQKINGEDLATYVRAIELDRGETVSIEKLKQQAKKRQNYQPMPEFDMNTTQPSTVASKTSRKSIKLFSMNLINQKQNYDVSNREAGERTSRLHRLSSEEYLMEDPMQISSDLQMLAQLHYERTLFRKVTIGMLDCGREGTFSEQTQHKDWLIECFYALKHNYQVNSAYKRRSKNMSFSGVYGRTCPASQSTLPFSLDIDMINETYDRQGSLIGNRAR